LDNLTMLEVWIRIPWRKRDEDIATIRWRGVTNEERQYIRIVSTEKKERFRAIDGSPDLPLRWVRIEVSSCHVVIESERESECDNEAEHVFHDAPAGVLTRQ
jgi:hypothetical protein